MTSNLRGPRQAPLGNDEPTHEPNIDADIHLIETIISGLPAGTARTEWFSAFLPRTAAMLAIRHRWPEVSNLPSDLLGTAVRRYSSSSHRP